MTLLCVVIVEGGIALVYVKMIMLNSDHLLFFRDILIPFLL